MMDSKFNISMYDMTMCLSNAIDLVSPQLSDHNKRVAGITALLMQEAGRPEKEIVTVVIAGLLHDIGALSLKERLDLLNFEVNNVQKHAELGYRHIKSFPPLSYVSPLIRYHHHSNKQLNEVEIPTEIAYQCGMLHLADRISILIRNDTEIFSQTGLIIETIKPAAGDFFSHEAVDAFLSASNRESFWLTATGLGLNRYLEKHMGNENQELDIDHLTEFARLFGRVIDFRSSFTAVHSRKVSEISGAIADYMGMNENECSLISIAGLLHDLGKLAVPSEILDKPAPLSGSEWNIMRKHPFYTYDLLSEISELDTVNRWASSHHERLDGTGYPFHAKDQEITQGERIIAAADIFTALTEDRPYRKGLETVEVVKIMKEQVENGGLDRPTVKIIESNYDYFDKIRQEAEDSSKAEYGNFIKET